MPTMGKHSRCALDEALGEADHENGTEDGKAALEG
jgi:hypothetical protein